MFSGSTSESTLKSTPVYAPINILGSIIGERFIVKAKYGGGSYGKVKLVIDLKNGCQDYAAKIFRIDSKRYSLDKIKQEFDASCNINLEYNPRLTRSFEFIEEITYLSKKKGKYQISMILMEPAQNLGLLDYLNHERTFSESLARNYFIQLVEGISHIHRQGYCHRDIKPNNLLFDDCYDLKICDFGFSKFDDGSLSTNLGTEGFKAPEVYTIGEYDGKKVDIFAMGVVLFMMVAGDYPFRSATNSSIEYNWIIAKKYDKFWAHHSEKLQNDFKKEFSPEFMDLVTKMIDLEYPEKNRFRITIEDIQKHPWFTNTNTPDIFSLIEYFNSKKKSVSEYVAKIKIALKKRKQQEAHTQKSSHGIKPYGTSRANDEDPELLEALDSISEYLKNLNLDSAEPNVIDANSIHPLHGKIFEKAVVDLFPIVVHVLNNQKFKYECVENKYEIKIILETTEKIEEITENDKDERKITESFVIQFYEFEETLAYVTFNHKEETNLSIQKNFKKIVDGVVEFVGEFQT